MDILSSSSARRLSQSKKSVITNPSNKKTPSVWIRCPICKGKTRTKVYQNTVLLGFPLYCPKCKNETRINTVNLMMTIYSEPDA